MSERHFYYIELKIDCYYRFDSRLGLLKERSYTMQCSASRWRSWLERLPRMEGRVFESQPRQTLVVAAPLTNVRQRV